MNDLDSRLARLFAGSGPAADFDARLAVRLEAERHREARLDRRAALDLALREHACLRAAQARRQFHALITVLGLGVLALLAVAMTGSMWHNGGEQLGLQLRAVAEGASAGTPAGMIWFVLPAALIVFASVRPRWVRNLWEATLG
jgi:hypothetical protein